LFLDVSILINRRLLPLLSASSAGGTWYNEGYKSNSIWLFDINSGFWCYVGGAMQQIVGPNYPLLGKSNGITGGAIYQGSNPVGGPYVEAPVVLLDNTGSLYYGFGGTLSNLYVCNGTSSANMEDRLRF
jgi:hypothetical protein